MSASKDKFQSHCTIMKYLDAKHPEIAELMRGTCADMTLGSTRGKSGVTLLLPTDKDFIASVEKDAYSSDPKIAKRACDRLNAIILRGVYKSASEMQSDKNLANSLYPAQKVDIKAAEVGKVTFANGAVATIDKGFIDSSPKGNLAVWLLAGKDGLPVTTDKPADTATKQKRVGKGKAGAYEDVEVSNRLRHQIAVVVQNAYGSQIATNQPRNAFCQATKSLLNHIAAKDGELFDQLALHVCHSIMDFYVLVQPHGYGAGPLIPDELIGEWWNNGAPAKVDCDEVGKKIEASLMKSAAARKELLEKVKEERKKLNDINDRSICDKLEASYEALSPEFKKLCPHFGDGKMRMVEDSLKYYTAVVCAKMREVSDYSNMLGPLGDSLYYANKGERFSTIICNKPKITYNIQPQKDIEVVKDFINSSLFMCVPMTRDECANMSNKINNIHADLWSF